MKTNLFKTFLTSGAILLGLSQLQAKTNVVVDDYILGEVTADNINIRSGAGTNFPKAYAIVTDWDGKKSKSEVMPAYKGQRFFVKDAGDWWEIETLSKASGDSPRYIFKKYLTLKETNPFDTDTITEPQIWASVEEVEDEEGEKMDDITIVTIYPDNVVLTYNMSPWENGLKVGVIKKDKSAAFNSINAWLSESGNDVAKNAPLKVWAHTESTPPAFMMEYGENQKKSFVFNNKKIEYIDLSVIPADQWIATTKEIIKSENSKGIRLFRSDPDAYLLLDDLSGFIRIK